jgi:hypothetical protein
MTDAANMIATIRRAWGAIPAPPAEDLQLMAWACGEASWRAFVNRTPMEVDVATPAFLGCTPLLDLPPRAAAAYLGSYLLSLLEGMQDQEDSGIFYDILTRAHVLACLGDPDFWEQVIRPHLSGECRTAMTEVALYLAAHRDLLGLDEQAVAEIVILSNS